MRAYGLTLLLHDDPRLISEYRRHHREVWPEVTARLREIGIRSMRIYLLGRRLFMCMEAEDGFDPARDFPRALENPRYRAWDELMRTMQERVPEAGPDEWWAAMELVFEL
ncbi:MAG TPA: L-rhamnose mutarotase [Candidatus Dormibacteraeota bacterium]